MKKKNEDIQFIFVGGCGRSGTTLIQKLLTSHSLINGGPEFGFTYSIFELYRKMNNSYNTGLLDKFIERQQDLIDNFKLFYTNFFNLYDKGKIKYISEKTPSNIFVANELMEFFPTATFINVVRDSRAVVNSHLKVKKRYKKNNKFAGFNIFSVCKLWNLSINEYLQLKIVYPKRTLNIKYEQLISKPEDTLFFVFNKLGLELEPHLLSPDKLDKNIDSAHINNIWYTPEMYNQTFNKEKINIWKNDLNLFQKIIINSLTAINLNKLGYPVPSIYLKVNHMLLLLKKENLRKLPFYKYYLKLRLFLS